MSKRGKTNSMAHKTVNTISTGNHETVKDFARKWIFAQYEMGRPVSAIAAEMKRSESHVYAKMRSKPRTYEEMKQVREEMSGRRVRRIDGLADDVIHSYMEYQQKKKDNPGFIDEKLEKAFADIERVMRIGKIYSDRKHQIDGTGGRSTSVIAAEIPIQVIIHKTYEKDAPGIH